MTDNTELGNLFSGQLDSDLITRTVLAAVYASAELVDVEGVMYQIYKDYIEARIQESNPFSATGLGLISPDRATGRAEVAILHDMWLAHHLRDGWAFADEWDIGNKKSPNVLPYHALSTETQFKYGLVINIVNYYIQKAREDVIRKSMLPV